MEVLSSFGYGRFIMRKALLPTKVNVIRKISLTVYNVKDKVNQDEYMSVENCFNTVSGNEQEAYDVACRELIRKILLDFNNGNFQRRYGNIQ